MITRRAVTAILGASAALPASAVVDRLSAATPSFDALLTDALANPDVLEKTRQDREGRALEFDAFAVKKVAPRYRPSDRKISRDAVKLIIAFEVTDQSLYEQRYQGPVWPGGDSGATIGIGYDLGYATKEWLHEDWGLVLSADKLDSLERACGVTGAAASRLLRSLPALQIPWASAYEQFMTTTLPRVVAETLAAVPNSSSLSDDCLGALVSLDYNRGPAFKLLGDRYKEMRAIRLHMVDKLTSMIPGEFRSMARLWPPQSGIHGVAIRRMLEASLFEKGLQAG